MRARSLSMGKAVAHGVIRFGFRLDRLGWLSRRGLLIPLNEGRCPKISPPLAGHLNWVGQSRASLSTLCRGTFPQPISVGHLPDPFRSLAGRHQFAARSVLAIGIMG